MSSAFILIMVLGTMPATSHVYVEVNSISQEFSTEANCRHAVATMLPALKKKHVSAISWACLPK